jgi:hypothetical protein
MASESSDRRDKAVMALGIVAVLLFSANLLTAVVHYFWPDYSESEVVAVAVDEVSPMGRVIVHRLNAPNTVVFEHRHTAPNIHFEVDVNDDFEREMAELEARIELQAADLEKELTLTIQRADVESSMKAAEKALKNVENQLRVKEAELKQLGDQQ